MKILIAGGSGTIGRAASAALRADGHAVVHLVRREAASGDELAWHPAAGELPLESCRTVDAVINLCGAGIADRRWTAARKQALLDSRVAPTERLVRAMGATGPRVLVNAGAVGIYGAMDDRPVDEGRAPGEGFLPQVCRQWEAAAEAASASGLRVVRLRLGVVLARDGGALPRMALPVRLFLGTRLGQGRQGLSWIHVDDLVRLILEAAANPACRGPVNATAPRPVSNETFTRTLAQRLRRPLLPVPAWATRSGISLLLGEMGVALLLEGAFVHPRQAERLGFAFQFQRVEDALADLL